MTAISNSSTDSLIEPKDRETRVVYLTPHARAVLNEWPAIVGVQTEGPVFPAPGGSRLGRRVLQRRFAEAMVSAGIPREHPELRLPRTFHSLRYSTSVLMQRRGYHPRLIEATLGHGSLELTYGVFGGWTPEMLAAEAAREPVDVATIAGTGRVRASRVVWKPAAVCPARCYPCFSVTSPTLSTAGVWL